MHSALMKRGGKLFARKCAVCNRWTREQRGICGECQDRTVPSNVRFCRCLVDLELDAKQIYNVIELAKLCFPREFDTE